MCTPVSSGTWIAPLALAGIVASPTPALAHAWFTYGFGSRAISMGNAFVAVADDVSMAYTNPAGGGFLRQAFAGGGPVYYDYALAVSGGTDPRDGGDIQEIFAGSFGTNVPIPVEDILGVHVSAGFALQLTKDVLLQQEVAFPTEAQLILIENYPRMLHLLPTVGVGLTPGVSVGMGLMLFNSTSGLFDLGLGATGEAVFEIDQEIKTVVSPMFGILLKPGEHVPALAPFQFGFVYRDSFTVPFRIPISAFLGGLPLNVDFGTNALYVPEQLEGGVAWTPREGWLVTAQLSWNRWSRFPDPSLSVDLDLVLPLLGCADDDPECGGILFTESFTRNPDFDDTLTPRVGIEARVATWETMDLMLRGGYAFEKSPVPEQVGDTNLLDNDRHIVSAGVGFLFRELLGRPFKYPLHVDVHVQVHVLPSRTHRKDPASQSPTGPIEENAGFPSIETSGFLTNAGFNVWTEIELL